MEKERQQGRGVCGVQRGGGGREGGQGYIRRRSVVVKHRRTKEKGNGVAEVAPGLPLQYPAKRAFVSASTTKA